MSEMHGEAARDNGSETGARSMKPRNLIWKPGKPEKEEGTNLETGNPEK